MTLKRGPYKVRFPEGSIGALIEIYRANSPKYKRLSPRSRYQMDRVLDKFRAKVGMKQASEMTLPIIERMRDMLSDTPAAANQWARHVGQVLSYSKRIGLIENNPLSEGLEKLPPTHPGGFRTWRDDEGAAYMDYWPAGSLPRLVFVLASCTGASAVDLVKLGWGNVEAGRIRYRRQKTERRKGADETPEVNIPLLPELEEELALLPMDRLTFLQTKDGLARSEGGLNHQFRAWVDEAGLGAPDKYGRRLSLHGLRKALGSRLAEKGASTRTLMAWLGHETAASVETYTKAYDRVVAADLGAELLAEKLKTNVTRIRKKEPKE